MPKPHRSGSEPAWSRTRASRAASRASSSASRAPVVPMALTTYTNPREARQASAIRSSVLVSETSCTRSMSLAAAAARSSSDSSGGTSATISASAPAAAASLQKRSTP